MLSGWFNKVTDLCLEPNTTLSFLLSLSLLLSKRGDLSSGKVNAALGGWRNASKEESEIYNTCKTPKRGERCGRPRAEGDAWGLWWGLASHTVLNTSLCQWLPIAEAVITKPKWAIC